MLTLPTQCFILATWKPGPLVLAAFDVAGVGNVEWSDKVTLTLANESASEQETKSDPNRRASSRPY